MRVTCVAVIIGVICTAIQAECEVVRKYDFNNDMERPSEFSSGGEIPHPENKAEGASVVLSDSNDYEGAGKCLVLDAGPPTGDPWYGGREFWIVLDKLPTKDLRVSLCFYTEAVDSIQPIAPVDGTDDNCYSTSVPVQFDGQIKGAWVQDPVQKLDNHEWGTVTWKLFENKFNATHVQINTDMHKLNGIRFHPSGHGDNKRTLVAIDNLVLYRGEDKEPPRAIKDLNTSAEKGVITLHWTRPEDNLFAVKYDIYRSASPDDVPGDATFITSTHRTSFKDKTIVNPGSYFYQVIAYDFAGNKSATSNTSAITLDEDGNVLLY